ncbi:MAG: Zinc transporter ZupT [Candidatus Woesearchaeota archaeon]|nr:Zinc transporter ZupT [Candidatus Woesearchaeota archaeon]
MLYIILPAVLGISLLSLLGVFFISINKKVMNSLVEYLVAIASGSLLGGAFLHILPEISKTGPQVFLYVLFGMLLFFLLEKILYWRHCHDGQCTVHAFTYLSLIGDAVHNFIDGIIISTAFLVSIPLGVSATVSIAFHEIPQEIGDFAVMIYGGLSKKKALLYNFLSAITALLGALVGFFLSSISGIIPVLLALSAGGFIYIASSDLIPELHKTKKITESLIQFALIILGILLMLGLKLVFE